MLIRPPRIDPRIRPALMAITAVAAVSALTSCASTSAAQSETPTPGVVQVVAGENCWGDIVRQVGGAHVRVTSIIDDPNTDPHEYETNAGNAAAVAGARLIVENGLGYDGFLSDLVGASPNRARSVLTVSHVLGVTGADANPHLWYDTARLPTVAAAIAHTLAALDPEDAAEFRANATRFDASLAPILRVIADIKSKYGGESIAYTERVPGYLIEAAGLKLGIPATFPRAVEDGNDPSIADTAAFDTAITQHTVRVLLYNDQVVDSQTTAIEQLATANHIPIVGVSETQPARDRNFQAWQLRQATALLNALGG